MPAATKDPSARFRILAFDGGGIRGLISVLVLADIEQRLKRRQGPEARLPDYFHLFAGTSTGGLITLALTAKRERSVTELAKFYTENGRQVFHRGLWQELRTGLGVLGPKYSSEPLEEALEARLGPGELHEAQRDVLVTSYDVRAGEPHFFKRWKAIEAAREGNEKLTLTRVARATSAAPTYFPPQRIGERLLVDGGVFANDPAVAAIAEALGRTEPPAPLAPEDLFMVSIGTGEFRSRPSWDPFGGGGMLGWAVGREGSPILDAMMNGAANGADYWSHMILNHVEGKPVPPRAEMGRGPRYFRLQAQLEGPVAMDDTTKKTLTEVLPGAATRLIETRGAEIETIVELLAKAGPIPPEP